MPPPKKDPYADVPAQLGPAEGLVRVGEGAMGAVFKARHTGMGIDVAVKVLNPFVGRKDPKAVARFVREVRLLATIHDPHVVSILDAGQEGKFTFAVMELISGQTLGELHQAEPEQRMADAAVAYYLGQVAQGLVAVHGCGVIHRDLKPDNVMVTSDGIAKIADFGLARGKDSQALTMMDEVVGTPEYMAPELIAHADVDGRADLYSLGCSAYQLLTGRTPFNQGSLLQIVQQHMHSQPVPVRVRNPQVSAPVEALVHRLLEKDPKKRFQNAGELARACAPLAAKQPPHRPTPRVLKALAAPQGQAAPPAARPSGRPLAGSAPASNGALPPWSELFALRLLAQHNVYPLETLLDGLEAWRRTPQRGPLLRFLRERARLPEDVARKVEVAAQRRQVDLRNRIAFSVLRGSRISPETLSATARSLAPGTPFSAALVQAGVLPDAAPLEQRIDHGQELAVQRCTQRACQECGVPPARLDELEARLDARQYAAVYRATVRALLEQLG